MGDGDVALDAERKCADAVRRQAFDRLIDRYVCDVVLVELEGCVTVAAVTVGVTDRMNDTDSEIGSCVFIIFTLLLIRVRITITIIHFRYYK